MAKTRRRVLSILMALVLVLGLLPTSALAGGPRPDGGKKEGTYNNPIVRFYVFDPELADPTDNSDTVKGHYYPNDSDNGGVAGCNAGTGYQGGSLTAEGLRQWKNTNENGISNMKGISSAWYTQPRNLGDFNGKTIVWYSMKQYKDDNGKYYCNIDGYVKGTPINVIYHSNFDPDQNYVDTGFYSGDPYTVKTYDATELSDNSGYTFKGWNTQANGRGTSYAEGAAIDALMTSLVLYAQWDEIEYDPSEAPTATLTLTKEWADNVTDDQSVTISLKDGSKTYTAQNGGTVTPGTAADLIFTGLTPGATYEIVESPADYELSQSSIDLSEVTVTDMDFETKIDERSCSNLVNTVVDLKGANYLVAGLTSQDGCIIWTYNELSLEEQDLFVKTCETPNGSYKIENPTFIHGVSASAAGVSIDANRGTITFSASSDWKQFFGGVYTYVYGGTENAVTITNSAKVADLTITKTFTGDLTSAPEGFSANFSVYRGETATGTPIRTFTYTDVADGNAKLENLPYGIYTVVETDATFPSAADYQTVQTSYKVNGGTQSNGTVTINSATGATVEVVNTYTEIAKPHLTLKKEVVSIAGVTGATSAQIGDAIVYEITVTNDGKAAASDVKVTDTVTNLTGLTVVGTPSAGSFDAATGVWTVGTLTDGDSATLQVTATVADSAISAGAVSGFVKNQVTGSYTFNDESMPEPTPDEVETPVYKSSLTIAKAVTAVNGTAWTDTGTPVVAPGDTVTFQITVTNKGFAADTVTVTDILPNEMTLAAGTDSHTSTGSVTIDDVTYTTYTWNKTVPAATSETDGGGMTTVAPGTATITVVAQVKADALPEGTYSKTVKNAATMNELTAEAEVEISNGDGGLKINKNMNGLTADKLAELGGSVSFQVTDSEDRVVENYTLVEVLAGEASLDLEPGEYTVTETVVTPDGYTLTTSIRVSNDSNAELENGSYTATVAKGSVTSVTFANTYTAKTYRIIFDAKDNGSLRYNDASITNTGYAWDDQLGWSSNNSVGETGKLSFLFELDNVDNMSAPGVTVQANPGYEVLASYVLNEDVKFETVAAIIEALDTHAEKETLSYTKLDGTQIVNGDVWTIRVYAEYDYDLTYTFNDFGSEHVSMAYYETVNGEIEANPVLTPVSAFGNASNPVEVCAQENLDDPSKFEPVIFFVKADDGYQLGEQYWEASSATALTSVEKSVVGELTALPPIERFPDDALLAAAHAAGYTHYFSYEENGVVDNVFKADVLNRYFKVVATENPTYTITGTKTVALGGNRAPGSTTFTFNLEGHRIQPVALATEIGGDVQQIEGTATVTINGSGSATFQFDTIEFTQEGWYTFRVTEKDDRANTTYWRYDNTEYWVDIQVIETDDGLKIQSVEMGIPQWENDELIDVKDVDTIAFTNTYTRSGGNNPGPGPGDGDGDGDTDIPDENTPTTDLPDENTPTTDLPDENTPTTETPEETTDLPDEETPLADVPETGDSTGVWVLAAGVSGLALVWLALTGKKRRDENA